MDASFFDQTFDKKNYKDHPLPKGEYENCTFSHCDFSESTLSEIRFIDCSFISCNLSLSNLHKTILRDVTFTGCKMLGLHFDHCDPFGLSFRLDGCILQHASFYQLKLKKSIFKNNQFQEADFTECDLSGAVLENCDFKGAAFDNTLLEGADLRTSFNYSIDPEKNKIKKAKFSISQIGGLLDKYDIRIDTAS